VIFQVSSPWFFSALCGTTFVPDQLGYHSHIRFTVGLSGDVNPSSARHGSAVLVESKGRKRETPNQLDDSN